jgi:hypothetical protein
MSITSASTTGAIQHLTALSSSASKTPMRSSNSSMNCSSACLTFWLGNVNNGTLHLLLQQHQLLHLQHTTPSKSPNWRLPLRHNKRIQTFLRISQNSTNSISTSSTKCSNKLVKNFRLFKCNKNFNSYGQNYCPI